MRGEGKRGVGGGGANLGRKGDSNISLKSFVFLKIFDKSVFFIHSFINFYVLSFFQQFTFLFLILHVKGFEALPQTQIF